VSLFITFEGGEGTGKSAQANALYQRLLKSAIPSVLTHEPGGTPLGDGIDHWLKWKEGDISPLAELFLFSASRSQLVDRLIKPSLEAGKTVVCDRYADSSIAYQGYGRGLDLKIIKVVNNAATAGLTPDLTLLLDIPAAEGLARKSAVSRDRFEKEDINFHQKVRDGYLKLAADEPERWLVIDARQNREKVAGIIWQKVRQLMRQKIEAEHA
jgi:dTMP kinase